MIEYSLMARINKTYDSNALLIFSIIEEFFAGAQPTKQYCPSKVSPDSMGSAKFKHSVCFPGLCMLPIRYPELIFPHESITKRKIYQLDNAFIVSKSTKRTNVLKPRTPSL